MHWKAQKTILPALVIAGLFFGLLDLSVPEVSAHEVELSKKIIIEENHIPSVTKPGDKPITLNEQLLSKLVPELKNPRLMHYDDLSDPRDRESFIEGGYTFVLTGDFIRNGFADIAFVGKYDNPESSTENCFFAVVSIQGKKIIREYFSKLKTKEVSLIRVSNYKSKTDAIGLVYKFETEECGYFFWLKMKLYYEPCKSVFP